MSTESKQSFTANLPSQIIPIYPEAVDAALRHVAFETDVTVKEIARNIVKAESTTYKKLDGQQEFTIAEFCSIVRLSVSKGVTELVDLMLPEGYAVVPLSAGIGESLAEEATELVTDLGRTVDDLRNGKQRKAVADATEVVADATAIARRVKGGVRK